MKINAVNNNQKQQSFGAIAGKNFEQGLISYLTGLRPQALQETLTLLNNPQAVSEFVAEFRDIKVAKTGYHGVLSPVFDITNYNNKDFYLFGNVDDKSMRGGEIQSQPGTNLFNMLLTRVRTALSGHQLVPRQTVFLEYSDTPTNKSIRESVHDLVALINKDNTAEVI